MNIQETTSGSVAAVSAPIGKVNKRIGKGVYPKQKSGNLLTGKVKKEITEWSNDEPGYGYSLRKPNGNLASSITGSPWWVTDESRARQANMNKFGNAAEVVRVRLDYDQYAYNGYMAYEVIDESIVDEDSLNEIEYNTLIDKRSGVWKKKDMDSEYHHEFNQYPVRRKKNYDIPELPGHTVETNTDGTEIYLVSDDDDDNEKEGVVGKISLGPVTVRGRRAYEVLGVQLVREYQGRGIIPTLYAFLVNDLGYVVKSGTEQSPGSAKLWAKLSTMPGITVHAYFPKANRGKGILAPTEIDPKTRRLKPIGTHIPLYDVDSIDNDDDYYYYDTPFLLASKSKK